METLPDVLTEEQRVEAQKKLDEIVKVTRGEVFAFVKTNPRDSAALMAIEWLSQFPDEPDQTKAMDAWLLEYHVGSPRLRGYLELLSQGDLTAGQRKFLESVAEKNPFPQIGGEALLTLAQALRTDADDARVTEADRKARHAEVRKLLEQLQQKFGKVESLEGSFADAAKEETYILDNLSVGCQAPPSVSEDLATGRTVRLADYRGQVVVVDFWATWCPLCVEMIPHERELVERLKDKKFSLISVDLDDEPGIARQFIAQNPMPWVHWFDGPEGKVAASWRIRPLPAIFVLDAKGVIRFKNLKGEGLDKAVDALLKELEAAK